MLFVSGALKYNQINLATLLNFSDLAYLSFFFGHDLGFKLVFGFELDLVGLFKTLLLAAGKSAEQSYDLNNCKRNLLRD